MQDFAKTWKNLTAASGGAIAAFKDFEWGQSLSRAGTGGQQAAFQDETILASAYESLEHARSASHNTWDPNVHFVTSHDFFASRHTRLVSCGNRFQLMGHRVCLSGNQQACNNFLKGWPVHVDWLSRDTRIALRSSICVFSSMLPCHTSRPPTCILTCILATSC